MIVAIAMAVPGPASADVVYNNPYVWESGDGFCGQGHAEISHGPSNGGYGRASIEGRKPVNFASLGIVNCYQGWVRASGNYNIAMNIHKWNGTNFNDVCVAKPFGMNATSGSGVQWIHDMQAVPDCGSGYYRTASGSFLKDFNGNWAGQWIDSRTNSNPTGSHYLPAS